MITAHGDGELLAKAVRYLTRTRKYNYWSNSFATAQVIAASVDYSRMTEELSPEFTYAVTLDGIEVASGSFSDGKQNKQILLSSAQIKQASKLAVTKTGRGELYSTLTVNEFHTDKKAAASDHGLKVSRRYVNEKGEGYSLGVGDAVTVEITVSGLQAEENYAAIEDELPAGIIPINMTFKNQQYGKNLNQYYSSYDVTDRDVTENGIVLSLYRIGTGTRVYTYKARVISQGTFIVPPTVASLMYAPEIYGRSAVQTLTVDKEAVYTPTVITKLPSQFFNILTDKNVLLGIGSVVVIVLILIYKYKKGQSNHPPINPPKPGVS